MIVVKKGSYKQNGIELADVLQYVALTVKKFTAFKDGDDWRKLETGALLNPSDMEFALMYHADRIKGAEAARKAREALNNE